MPRMQMQAEDRGLLYVVCGVLCVRPGNTKSIFRLRKSSEYKLGCLS